MDTMVLQQKRLLRVDEVAKILNISRWTVYRWVEAGRLGGTRLGAGSLRIFSETVSALIDHHCVGLSTGTMDTEKTWQVASPGQPPTRRETGREGIRSHSVAL